MDSANPSTDRRRDIVTIDPREGDYILSSTGTSWNVLRSNGDHSGTRISAGDHDKPAAIAKIRSLTEDDRADGWETGGTGLFWQITQFRN